MTIKKFKPSQYNHLKQRWPVFALLAIIAFLLIANFAVDKTFFANSNIINTKPFSIPTITFPSPTIEEVTAIPIPTVILTPMPTVISSIDCNIGQITINIPQGLCDKAKTIQSLRNQDTATVQKKINDLINEVKPYLDQFNEVAGISCAFYGFGSPDLNTQAMSSCLSSNQQLMQSIQMIINSYNAKITWHKNYLSGIQDGTGSGACSDHAGVSCSRGRTDIGQVICNDGWRESQVYYFNVKECLNYFLLGN